MCPKESAVSLVREWLELSPWERLWWVLHVTGWVALTVLVVTA